MIKNKAGYTITEILISVLLSSIILTSLMALWYFSLKSWGTERIRSKVRSDLQITMERIKDEVRITSTNQMFFYPANSSECTAMSFALASWDANGFVNLSGGTINWYKTIIYHVYTNNEEKKELRRTTFWPRVNSWTTAQFQSQLESVVTTGDGAASKGSMSTSTETLFCGEVDLKITPKAQQFDLYSLSIQRSNLISFGSVMLTSGSHNLKFEVVGQNILATSYNIGIDCLSITPSGGFREAEYYLPPVASSGQAATKENMSAYGSYSDNHQLLYSSTAKGNFMTLLMYYDAWHESNFQDFVLSNIANFTTGDSYLKLPSREEGATQHWTAEGQTEVPAGDCATDLKNMSIRTIIFNDKIFSNKAVMLRVKFRADSNSAHSLTINKAYIAERSPGTQNAVPGTTAQLYFSDAPLLEGSTSSDPGSVGLGPEGRVIPGGYYTWSNWAYFAIDKSALKDYIVTFETNDISSSYSTYWPKVSGANSYTRDGQYASEDTWGTFSSNPSIFAFAEIQGWLNIGTATSTIYDTKLSAPNFNQIKWTQSSLANTTVSFKVRTSSDPLMTGAPAWDTITEYTSNPSSLAGLTQNRYVQFQAILSNSYPYISFPTMDDCIIDWPGATALVEISGYFTKGPQYGIFKLSVDGKELIKGTEVGLTNTETYLGKTYSASLTAEVSPRNTGK